MWHFLQNLAAFIESYGKSLVKLTDEATGVDQDDLHCLDLEARVGSLKEPCRFRELTDLAQVMPKSMFELTIGQQRSAWLAARDGAERTRLHALQVHFFNRALGQLTGEDDDDAGGSALRALVHQGRGQRAQAHGPRLGGTARSTIVPPTTCGVGTNRRSRAHWPSLNVCIWRNRFRAERTRCPPQ